MKSEILCCALLVLNVRQVNSTQYSLLLDETLQQFREGILEFQSSSMVHLDNSFFDFYGMIHAKFNSNIIHPFTELREEFQRSCSQFPFYNLEVYAARRLINICDDIQISVKRVFNLCDKIIDKYYQDPESLTAETLEELLAVDFYANVNKQYEFVVAIYNLNSSCVKPLLQSFLPIYKIPIQKMIKTHEKRITMFQKRNKRHLKFIITSIEKLFGVALKIRNCSDESVLDTFDCVRAFVGYDCKKKKSGCGVFYKSIYMALDHLKHIDNYYEIYEGTFDKVYESFKKIEKLLMKWGDGIDKCVFT